MEKNKGAAANAVSMVDSVQPPTYVEIGISRNLASEAQVLATLPEPDQNDVISGKKSKKAAKKKHRIYKKGIECCKAHDKCNVCCLCMAKDECCWISGRYIMNVLFEA